MKTSTDMAGLLRKTALILYCLRIHLNLRPSNIPELMPYSNNIMFFFFIIVLKVSCHSLCKYNVKLTGECACLGDTLTYSCTVLGSAGGATVWSGTAFDCPTNEITLLHSVFKSGHRVYGVCNNGAIVAQRLGVENSYYTSQLNVRLTSDVVGKTVTCINVLNLTSDVVQFTTTIENTTGKYFMFTL